MKKIIFKILKWSGILLLLLIIAAILIPIFFKDEIKEMVLHEVNKNLTAELELDDFDLTFLSTFPNMTIELNGARLKGKDDFEGVTLADIKKAQAHVDFWSVLSDQIEVDEIHIFDPLIDVRVLQDGKANYDIVKPDSVKTEEELAEPSNFKLSLKEYSITNAKLTYDDHAYNMYFAFDSLNHRGTGDLTADVIDFETVTDLTRMSYRMDGISYLTEASTDAQVNLLMEFKDESSKFTLKENEIKLNEVLFSIDGYYEMLEDHDEMDFKLNAAETDFKELLSLIPAFYHSGYEGMVAKADVGLNGELKGRMDDVNLPGWDFGLSVKNASIKYPDLPGMIKNIQIQAGSKFPGGDDLNKLTVEVPKFKADFDKNKIDANLFMSNIMYDPVLKSKIIAFIDLATLGNYVPMTEGESYSGTLDADVNIDGKMSDLEKGDFEAFTAEGQLLLANMNYKSSDLPDAVQIDKMLFNFAPQMLSLNEFKGKMGATDFAMKGKVDNYFGYMLRDEVLKGDFAFSSNNFDLDQLMPASEEATAEESSSESSSSSDPILIPANIDFRLASNLNNVKYNGLDFKNLVGTIILKDETAILENLTMNAMGGKVALKGAYNTQDHQTPKMDFAYDLKEIDIHTLATHFVTVEKLAPLTKYAQGKISSSMDMQSLLTADFMPVLSSLSSIGNVSSSSLSFTDIKLLNKIEDKTKLNNLSSQTLKNFYTKFSVDHGKVMMLPANIKLDGIDTEVSGYTTLDKKINYNFDMQIPKEKIPGSILKEAEKALQKANSLIPGIKLAELPNFIPVKVNASGDATNPKITTDIKEAVMKATGNMTENITENITNIIKDTISNVIEDQKENLNEEIEKQKQNILSEAQKQADQIVAQGKVAADKVRAEAKKQGDALIKEAGSNPIKKKIAEQAALKLESEAEVKAQKIEAEAKTRADEVMRKARERADALG